MPNTIAQELLLQTRGLLEQDTLLDEKDRLEHEADEPSILWWLASQEGDEVAQELSSLGTPDFNANKLQGEMADMFVFYNCAILAGDYGVSMVHVEGHINGIGKRSNAIELTQQALLDSADGDPKAQLEALRRLLSLQRYLPQADIPFTEVYAQTIDKVLNNRPPYLYSMEDVDHRVVMLMNSANMPIPHYWQGRVGRRITKDEVSLKYNHLEACLRLVRSAVGRTLHTSDIIPHLALIADWRQSQTNIEALRVSINDIVREH